MRQRIARVVVVALIASGLGASAARAGDVNIGITVGAPPPPVIVAPAPAVVVEPPRIVLSAPPTLVVVPGRPVSYVPGIAFNLFFYGGRYYTFHDGHWFHGGSHQGPWKAIKADRVPGAVVGVPVAYYNVPPRHAKKGHGAAAVHCPPGQAKKGRC
jgi:hypothetical protein